MLQLILHGIGDFLVQTDTLAINKKKRGWFGFKCCLIHCVTYSLPFLFIGSLRAVFVIFITHFIIDRTKIIDYLIAWKNNTIKITETNIGGVVRKVSSYDITNFGFSLERPFAISIWLYIITDNLIHIICNYLALYYLN